MRPTMFFALLFAYVGARPLSEVAESSLEPIVPNRPRFPLRILPLGASITRGQGSADGNGYRQHLHQMLEERDTIVDMVGTVSAGTMLDNECEGWPGARVDEVANYAKQAVQFRPNLILINAGTNDAIQNFDVDKTGERMDELVSYLFKSIPLPTIIVSTLLPSSDDAVEDRVRNTINPQYKALVKRRQANGERILLADWYSALKLSDLSDGIHPNDEGYRKLADVWLEAIYKAGSYNFLVEPRGGGLPDGSHIETSSSNEESDEDSQNGDSTVPETDEYGKATYNFPRKGDEKIFLVLGERRLLRRSR